MGVGMVEGTSSGKRREECGVVNVNLGTFVSQFSIKKCIRRLSTSFSYVVL
jgi:hypothetical protein